MELPKLYGIRTACFLFTAAACVIVHAQHRPFAPVPPTMEIEVLDPGVESLGNPAVQLKDGQVEIPPVVLVHRYYYSGDRSFQGPMLPGGPSILVVNHPSTGDRLYVPAQMMPGAPRVTYTKKRITYQYEKHAIILHFGLTGKQSIKYRSGLTWKQKVGKVLHAEHVSKNFTLAHEKSKRLCDRCKTTAVGVTADVVEASRVVTVPVCNILQTMPFGKRLFTGELEEYYAERAAVFRRDITNQHAEKRARLDELSIPTNR